jgi:hypothetical protein
MLAPTQHGAETGHGGCIQPGILTPSDKASQHLPVQGFNIFIHLPMAEKEDMFTMFCYLYLLVPVQGNMMVKLLPHHTLLAITSDEMMFTTTTFATLARHHMSTEVQQYYKWLVSMAYNMMHPPGVHPLGPSCGPPLKLNGPTGGHAQC